MIRKILIFLQVRSRCCYAPTEYRHGYDYRYDGKYCTECDTPQFKTPHEHSFATWSHGPEGYPKERFFAGTALLKNPECWCGVKQFNTKKEIYQYRQKLKAEMPQLFNR